MTPIEPKYFKLKDLFSERVFEIPPYQRYYSWKQKQVAELCGDIRKLYVQDEVGDHDHFMATIVCYRTGDIKKADNFNYKVYEIVDGQQRITTLALLLRAIADNCKDNKEGAELLRLLRKDDNNLLLIQANNINKSLFNTYLRTGLAPSGAALKTQADEKLSEAIEEINKFLGDWLAEGKDLVDLRELVLNRIGFIVCDTNDQSAVYTIFECLNSRGLPVDWLDKTKTMLMGVALKTAKSHKAAQAIMKELQDQWSKIYDALGASALAGQPIQDDEVLRIAATLHRHHTVGRPLSAEESLIHLADDCEKNADATVDITNRLLAVVERLVDLLKNRSLEAVTDVFQVRMLGVALKLTDLLNEKERESALNQWERVSFRIFKMYGKDARTEVGNYVRLATDIINKNNGALSFDQILIRLKELGEDYPVKSAIKELLNHPRYEGFETECRYILWRYEEYLAEKDKRQVSAELKAEIWNARKASDTIEHIMPQNWKRGGPWEHKLNPHVHADKQVHRLGNLLLLPRNLNREASNAGFAEKRKVFKKADQLLMVRAVSRKLDWRQKDIDQREKLITKFLREKFDDVPSLVADLALHAST